MVNRTKANYHHCFVWLLLGVSIFCGLGNGAPRKCLRDKTYFDKFTHRRECCADICEDARLRRTEEECKKNCPDYDAPEVDKMLGRQDDSHDDEESSQPGSNVLVPTLVALVLAVIVIAAIFIVTKVFSKKGRGRGLPGHQEQGNQGNHVAEGNQAEGQREGMENHGPPRNNEALETLLPRNHDNMTAHNNGNVLARNNGNVLARNNGTVMPYTYSNGFANCNGNLFNPGYAQSDVRRDDQRNAFPEQLPNGVHTTAVQQGEGRPQVVVAAQLQQQQQQNQQQQQQAANAERRTQARGAVMATREARPLPCPINESGDGNHVTTLRPGLSAIAV